MAGDLNRVTLIGRLGADPEVRHLNGGGKVCNLRIATSEKWRNKSTGEMHEKTEWSRVTVWPEGLVKLCEQYLKKGDRVFVEGKLSTRKWTDQGGVERYSTDIVLQGFDGKIILLGGKNARKEGEEPEDGGENYADKGSDFGGVQPRQPATAQPGRRDDMDDEIPF
jgi:single-strand DNA-binding protein